MSGAFSLNASTNGAWSSSKWCSRGSWSLATRWASPLIALVSLPGDEILDFFPAPHLWAIFVRLRFQCGGCRFGWVCVGGETSTGTSTLVVIKIAELRLTAPEPPI